MKSFTITSYFGGCFGEGLGQRKSVGELNALKWKMWCLGSNMGKMIGGYGSKLAMPYWGNEVPATPAMLMWQLEAFDPEQTAQVRPKLPAGYQCTHREHQRKPSERSPYTPENVWPERVLREIVILNVYIYIYVYIHIYMYICLYVCVITPKTWKQIITICIAGNHFSIFLWVAIYIYVCYIYIYIKIYNYINVCVIIYVLPQPGWDGNMMEHVYRTVTKLWGLLSMAIG